MNFMRQFVVAGNWKMNGSISQTTGLINDLIVGIKKIGGKVADKIIICPPNIYLPLAQSLLADSPIRLGAQNINQHDFGAHTGEINTSMVGEFDTEYALVGHSERRANYGDDDIAIIAKIEAAQNAGIVPIFCVGESLDQREQGQTQAVISQQIQLVIDALGIGAFVSMIIAYEPIWAIGTGKTATPDQAQQVHLFIRNLLAQNDNTIAAEVSILYGGSVNSKNATSLFACEDIDGGLVGGASLKADDFLKIVQG